MTPISNRKSISVRKISLYQVDDSPRFRSPKRKNKWTDEETEFLRKGMETFGCDWSAIKATYSLELARWDTVNLKDRARNVKTLLSKTNKPLGIWHLATNYKKKKPFSDLSDIEIL
jgi:hypothetical protein